MTCDANRHPGLTPAHIWRAESEPRALSATTRRWPSARLSWRKLGERWIASAQVIDTDRCVGQDHAGRCSGISTGTVPAPSSPCKPSQCLTLYQRLEGFTEQRAALLDTGGRRLTWAARVPSSVTVVLIRSSCVSRDIERCANLHRRTNWRSRYRGAGSARCSGRSGPEIDLRRIDFRHRGDDAARDMKSERDRELRPDRHDGPEHGE